MRFLKLWPWAATVPPYAGIVYNRPLPCSLPQCVLRRSDRICRKHAFVVPPRAKKWIFLLCSSIVIRKCQVSFLFYFNITTFAHVYESGAGCHVRNPTPIIFWARGNVAMEHLTSYFLVYKEEQRGIKTTANFAVSTSSSDFKQQRKRENKPPPMCYTLSNLEQNGWHVSRAWHLRSRVSDHQKPVIMVMMVCLLKLRSRYRFVKGVSCLIQPFGKCLVLQKNEGSKLDRPNAICFLPRFESWRVFFTLFQALLGSSAHLCILELCFHQVVSRHEALNKWTIIK